MSAYTYVFGSSVKMQQVQDALTLALLALESLNGATRLRLGVRYRVDREKRTCSIEADTRLGDELNLLFAGYIRREFGDGAFRVTRHTVAEGAPQEPLAA